MERNLLALGRGGRGRDLIWLRLRIPADALVELHHDDDSGNSTLS